MDEYISKKDILQMIESTAMWNRSFSILYEDIEDMKPADVAPVVHCCDCKHLRIHNNEEVYACCSKTGYIFLPFETDTRAHFCGFGERMDGDG